MKYYSFAILGICYSTRSLQSTPFQSNKVAHTDKRTLQIISLIHGDSGSNYRFAKYANLNATIEGR